MSGVSLAHFIVITTDLELQEVICRTTVTVLQLEPPCMHMRKIKVDTTGPSNVRYTKEKINNKCPISLTICKGKVR